MAGEWSSGVGYDMIPMDLCKEMGIKVTNLPGSNKKVRSVYLVPQARRLSHVYSKVGSRTRLSDHLVPRSPSH